MQIEIDQGKAHHVRGDIIAAEIGHKPAFVVRGKEIAGPVFGVLADNVFV